MCTRTNEIAPAGSLIEMHEISEETDHDQEISSVYTSPTRWKENARDVYVVGKHLQVEIR
jgi:hypothetical protein